MLPAIGYNIYNDTLYFKYDNSNSAERESRGCDFLLANQNARSAQNPGFLLDKPRAGTEIRASSLHVEGRN